VGHGRVERGRPTAHTDTRPWSAGASRQTRQPRRQARPHLSHTNPSRRHDHLRRWARVIAISQFADAEFTHELRRAGALEFVNKEELSRLTQIISRPEMPFSKNQLP
jgi:hypothetical protein